MSEEDRGEPRELEGSLTFSPPHGQLKGTFEFYPPLVFQRYELKIILEDHIEDLRAHKKPLAPSIGVAISFLGILITLFIQDSNFTAFIINPINIVVILLIVSVLIYLVMLYCQNRKITPMSVTEFMEILIEKSMKNVKFEKINE